MRGGSTHFIVLQEYSIITHNQDGDLLINKNINSYNYNIISPLASQPP